MLAYYDLVGKQIGDNDHPLFKSEIRQGLLPLYDYARTMNMPRMHAGAALARARLCFNDEEYTAASEAAQQALAIATRYNLELTKIDALHLLGSAFLKLGMIEAKGLLIRAKELSIHCEYNVKINAIELVLAEELV